MSILTTEQTKILSVPAHIVKKLGISTVTLRYDDQCGNGHNTFSMTASGRDMGGCCHDAIVQAFPYLEPFIKWHLCSNDGPLHYMENTMYHAAAIPLEQGKWWFSLENKKLRIVDVAERERMIERYGEQAHFESYPNPMAKESNLDAARSSAVWPEATDAELVASDLREKLEKRLPRLLEDFRAAMEKLGFTF
jgi:hypothetical protein